MSAVLFIVTIPTEAEEQRLKQEFITRKYDSKSDQIDSEPGAVPAKTATFVTPTPSAKTATINGRQKLNNTTSEAILIKQATPSATTDNVSSTDDSSQQYGTFPKRRKSELSKRLLDHIEGMTKTNSAGGSLKDMEFNTPHGTVNKRKSWDDLGEALSTAKRKYGKKKDRYADVELTHDTCMEIVLRVLLRKYQIQNDVWTKDDEGRMYQIFFNVEFNETYEKILDNFNEWGVGDRDGSTVSVMNCIAAKAASSQDDDEDNDYMADNNLDQKQGAWERFMNSVRSRLNVTQIVKNVRQDASITFDFVVLVISAAILAAFGLNEDSTVFLAASMLISPLMGPIIATIFGTVIKDQSLFRLGFKNELIGILMAITVGFIFGIIVCLTDGRYSIGDGLTDEMLSRCELHSLIVGVFTAIPSGAAAAIGILGGNIGSLVGVAISASLLPPAVNSGILWAIALIYKIYENDDTRFAQVVKSTKYSANQANELAILAMISMCLTISNIICIYIMGIIVLKVKEIAPAISSENREFWKHDIKIARGLKRTRFDSDNAIIDEYSNLPKEDQRALGIDYDMLRTMQLDDESYQNTWSPPVMRQQSESYYEPHRRNYMTVHKLDQLYSTVTNPSILRDKRPRFSMGHRRVTGRLTDFGTYNVLNENLPRCSTMPSKAAVPTIKIVTPNDNLTTPTYVTDEQKRRKFTVTPAEDDPLQSLCPPDKI